MSRPRTSLYWYRRECVAVYYHFPTHLCSFHGCDIVRSGSYQVRGIILGGGCSRFQQRCCCSYCLVGRCRRFEASYCRHLQGQPASWFVALRYLETQDLNLRGWPWTSLNRLQLMDWPEVAHDAEWECTSGLKEVRSTLRWHTSVRERCFQTVKFKAGHGVAFISRAGDTQNAHVLFRG